MASEVSVIGFDTSNYTTSCACISCKDGTAVSVISKRKLLEVKSGQLGLRQSEAVFQHTKQLPLLMESLAAEAGAPEIAAVCASNAPRDVQGSYMPCFLVGEGAARIAAASNGLRACFTTHQMGHILAALYGSGRLSLLKEGRTFLAFHVSGGTTDLLLCRPDKDKLLTVEQLSGSLDLKAGQAVDRVGVSMGLDFPCGVQLERLALNADRHYMIKPSLKDGSCCLSGLENKCAELLRNGEIKENVAAFCLDYIGETLKAMAEYALDRVGEASIVFSGGVMSDTVLRDKLGRCFDSCFADGEYSCDNAVGVALYAALRKGLM